jgi:hypothetical protein
MANPRCALARQPRALAALSAAWTALLSSPPAAGICTHAPLSGTQRVPVSQHKPRMCMQLLCPGFHQAACCSPTHAAAPQQRLRRVNERVHLKGRADRTAGTCTARLSPPRRRCSPPAACPAGSEPRPRLQRAGAASRCCMPPRRLRELGLCTRGRLRARTLQLGGRSTWSRCSWRGRAEPPAQTALQCSRCSAVEQQFARLDARQALSCVYSITACLHVAGTGESIRQEHAHIWQGMESSFQAVYFRCACTSVACVDFEYAARLTTPSHQDSGAMSGHGAVVSKLLYGSPRNASAGTHAYLQLISNTLSVDASPFLACALRSTISAASRGSRLFQGPDRMAEACAPLRARQVQPKYHVVKRGLVGSNAWSIARAGQRCLHAGLSKRRSISQSTASVL